MAVQTKQHTTHCTNPQCAALVAGIIIHLKSGTCLEKAKNRKVCNFAVASSACNELYYAEHRCSLLLTAWGKIKLLHDCDKDAAKKLIDAAKALLGHDDARKLFRGLRPRETGPCTCNR